MSKDIWFVSDTHFNHANICKFEHKGQPLRPWDDVEEMNAVMVERWNDRVQPHDKINHLGDVVMKKADLHRFMPLLNGKKRLVRGNHDICSTEEYMLYFEQIHGVRVLRAKNLGNIIFSHYPVHPDSLEFGVKWNVHGHMHGPCVDDPRYLNISCEHTDYAPIHFDEIIDILSKRKV